MASFGQLTCVGVCFFSCFRYGVSLIGIQKTDDSATIQLNPGPRHIMRPTDTCFYMNITKEENSAFILRHPREDQQKDKMDFSKTTNYVPPDNGGMTKVESAIASVGTLALELHHIGGKPGSPVTSATTSPKKPRESYLSPEGRESPGTWKIWLIVLGFFWLTPLRTVDSYSSNLRDATGPVDMYRRIPTSSQVTCIAA